MTNPDDVVFPAADPGCLQLGDLGLSNREWFAGLALQGLLANGGYDYETLPADAARIAVIAADALIDSLNKSIGESK